MNRIETLIDPAFQSGPPPIPKRAIPPLNDAVLAAIEVTVPPTTVPTGYRFALGLLATGLTLIPLIYVALLAFLIYLVVWHTTQTFITFSDGPFFVFHVPMAFLGGLLLVFLIKPVFFRKRSKDRQIVTLTESAEPLLFAYVNKLCQATGSQMPTSIEVDCDANAHARLRNGFRSIGKGDLVLRIGLPLAADLSLRQFTGVLAHELGHFNQKHGMSGSYLIRRLTFFFAHVVFQRDKLDEKLMKHRFSPYPLQKGFYWLLRGPIEAARGVLWLMLIIGELLTCHVLRRMEYDADRMEAFIAGTSDFITTSHRLAFLQLAQQVARADLMETWASQRLPEDLPKLMVLNREYLGRTRPDFLKRLERQTTRWLDTHPAHIDRIRAVQLMNLEPLMKLDAAATQLFSDFAQLSRKATSLFYREHLGEKAVEAKLVATEVIGQERIQRREAYRTLRRFMRGHISVMKPVLPSPEANLPLENLATAPGMLQSARQTMLRTAGEMRTESERLGKDAAGIAVNRAQLALCDMFSRSPQAARVRGRASRFLRKTEPSHGKALQQYQPFATAATQRLTTALRVLQTDGVSWPRAGGGQDYIIARRARAMELVAASQPLQKLAEPINRLGSLALSIRVFMSAYNKINPQPPLVRQVLATIKEAAAILQHVFSELSGIRYPLEHATDSVSIGSVLVPRLPAERDAGDTYECAITALDGYSLLVTRILAELSEMAEESEEAVKLDALTELAEADSATEAGRGSGAAWKYWVGYSARAVSGITMFSVLVWLSLNPPVIPQMPWEDGSARGGYQPNSFHVPFTPPVQVSNYQPMMPGNFRPGVPHPIVPSPYAPRRPGQPLPPGAQPYQPLPSMPWSSAPSSPSNPNRSMPGATPWGGRGGGGFTPGGGGGGRGGGGGGHR